MQTSKAGTVLAAFAVILVSSALIFPEAFFGEKIQKVKKIKQSMTFSQQARGEIENTGNQLIINKIIQQSKAFKAKREENEKTLVELKKTININCTALVYIDDCTDSLKKLASDKSVLDSLKKLSEAGVNIWISRFARGPFENKVYINENGDIVMYQETSLTEMKKFLGLN